MSTPFEVHLDDGVAVFVVSLSDVPRQQVERDLVKLSARGLTALPPLTGNIQGSVWELRSKVDGHGLYRIFYFRDGEQSFRAFHAYQKKTARLPPRVRAEVLKRYEEITGKKP